MNEDKIINDLISKLEKSNNRSKAAIFKELKHFMNSHHHHLTIKHQDLQSIEFPSDLEFNNCTFYKVNFERSSLHSSFHNVIFKSCNFERTSILDISEVTFIGDNHFYETVFMNLPHCGFFRAHNQRFIRTTFDRVKVGRYADFPFCDFESCFFKECCFMRSDFNRVHFKHSILQHCIFDCSDFIFSIFDHVTIKYSNSFGKVDFRNAKFNNVKIEGDIDLYSIRYDNLEQFNNCENFPFDWLVNNVKPSGGFKWWFGKK